MSRKRSQRDRAHRGNGARSAGSRRKPTTSRPRWPLIVGGILVLGVCFVVYLTRSPSFPPVRPTDPGNASPKLLAAIEDFVAQVAARPHSAESHGDLGLLYAENGFQHEAVACFQNAEWLDGENLVWPFHRAMSMREIGERASAAALLKSLADRAGAFAAINYELGVSYTESGDFNQAAVQFERASKRVPNAPEPLVALADVLNRMDRHEKARDISRSALKLDPDYSAAHHQLGLALRGVGDRDGALRELQLGVSAEPRSMSDPLSARAADLGISRSGRIARAVSAFRQGNLAGAETMLKQLFDEYPEDVAVLNNYAAILIESKRYDPALEILNNIVRIDDKTFGPHINLSHCCLKLGRNVDAVVHARNAVSRGGNVSHSHVALGDALLSAEDVNGALRAYERALELSPDNVRLLLVMGGLCRQNGRLDLAIQYFMSAAEKSPDSFAAHANLCTLALDTGAIESAFQAFSRAEAIDPDHPRTAELRQRLQVVQRQ